MYVRVQVMLVFYTMVCLAFLLYARIIGSSSYYYAAFNFMDGALQLSTSACMPLCENYYIIPIGALTT